MGNPSCINFSKLFFTHLCGHTLLLCLFLQISIFFGGGGGVESHLCGNNGSLNIEPWE